MEKHPTPYFRCSTLNFGPALPLPCSMKLLLIDTSRTFMAATRRALAAGMPTLEITEYDAEQQGPPGADFRWHVYGAALLSHELGAGQTGLQWLQRYRGVAGFPPVILYAASGDEYLAVAAVKAGAEDYLRRADVPSARTLERLRALETRPSAGEPSLRLDHFAREVLDFPIAPEGPAIEASPHRFVRLIGQGGFASVYLAERTHDRTPIVLKIINTQEIQEPAVVQRFMREATIVAGIDHPQVVKIYEQGFTPEYGFIAMEFFQRGDLKQRMERGLPTALAVAYMRSIALGLRAIHAQQIVHRDLKPGNIMFRADDSLALADFGISKRLDDPLDLTTRSGLIGTPSYLSPEQALGAPTDQRSDLYSAGVIFYELLTGQKPFRAESAAALVYQHVHATPPRLPATLAPIQPVLDLLLAKDPADRFHSADELLSGLDDWLTPAFRRAA